jgi:hypothetical protein
MSRRSDAPAAPVDHFVDGSVWQIRVDHQTTGPVFGNPVAEPKEYLVLVRSLDVLGKVRWVRTRLVMGDLMYRPLQLIYDDFVALMLQRPPVRSNYTFDLESDHGDPIRWIEYKGECHVPSEKSARRA